MTTPTPIATFEDILAAMENNPQLQAAMRQHVLDQEFLQLPAIVRELHQTVAQLAQLVHDYIAATDARFSQIEERLDRLEAGQARLEGDVTELKAGQARLEGDVAELKAGQARLEKGQANLEGDVAELKASQARLDGNMNRLIGSDYERKAARRASRLAQRQLSLRDMQVIYAITLPDDNRLPDLLDQAITAGRIDDEEADELENADLILAGTGHYVLAETSVTVDENDVRRARYRADLLAKATTAPARATVIGAHALDSAVQYAAINDVAILILPE